MKVVFIHIRGNKWLSALKPFSLVELLSVQGDKLELKAPGHEGMSPCP